MATIARAVLEVGAAEPWSAIVDAAAAWLDAAGAEPRDAVLLVPFAQLLPLARRAWARRGGWMPRIETTETLAASLGPPEAPGPAQLTFETALDRLVARRLLRQQAWAQAWLRRDPRGYDQAIGALVHVAHALARAAAAWAPDEREAHWARARHAVAASGGPAVTERLLARVAIEWAAASAAASTDRLASLRPSAWIAVQAGGEDPLVAHLLARSSSPALLIDADPDPPFAACGDGVMLAACRDFEDEARRSAAEVLASIARGDAPVALIAGDRVLVRRVRALLARAGVPIQDETGWKLSTTRAGAQVATLLKAARGDATCDDRLDWLKGLGHWPGEPGSDVDLEVLEGVLRRRQWTQPAAVDPDALPPRAARLWAVADAALEPLRAPRTRSLRDWLEATVQALAAGGALAALRDDDAGRQVLEALHLDDPLAVDDRLDVEDYLAWVDAVLEEGTFRPEAPPDAPVVITPLERALLRPFGALVLAGADEKRLGARPAPWPFLDDATAGALGLPTRGTRSAREALAFAHALRVRRVVLLRRRDDGGEPLAPSPLLERLELARLAQGLPPLPEAADATVERLIDARPTRRPAARAGDRLPARLSASACEALRACPYRFHALHVLGLREVEELDDEVEKRDYGNWLHEVLLRFHSTRSAPGDAATEAARLHAIAAALDEERHVEPAAFLPYAASFAAFVPRYVAWLHARDRDGAAWLGGEEALEAQPPGWDGIAMYGRVDRIDRVPRDGAAVLELIDYKTGSAEKLRERLKAPLEDTQLAFYAALVGARDGDADIEAAYLPVDERDRLRLVHHHDVAATARLLVEQLGGELARVRAGEPLPALGEGEACTWCAARGLCRRDHWAAEEDAT